MTRRGGQIALVLALLLPSILLPPASAAPEIPVVDLREDPGWLPYRFEIVMAPAESAWLKGGWRMRHLFQDIDGDGHEDTFRVTQFGVSLSLARSLRKTDLWHNTLPPAFTTQEPCGSIDGAWDVDGDGALEAVITASTADGGLWMFRLIDIETGKTKREFTLPGGPDTRGDGGWDGNFRVIGPLTATGPDGPRPGLLIASEAGYDIEPRGMRVLDAVTGDVLWTYLTGPKPIIHTISIADLDGDGSSEVIFGCTGVGNMTTQSFNGTQDDRAMVFVLNDDGALRWSVDMGPAPAGCDIALLDVEDDGRLEVLICGHLPHLGGDGLELRDADGGSVMSLIMEGYSAMMLVSRRDEGAWNAYLTYTSTLRRCTVSRDGIALTTEARINTPRPVALATDLVDRPGLELITGGLDGRIFMLDEDLQPLAMLKDERVRFHRTNTQLLSDLSGPLLVNLGDNNANGFRFRFVPNPRPFPWWLSVPAAGLAGAGFVAWRRRRPAHSAITVREMQLQLLGRLQLSGHGAIGALSSLRRIVWHLDTIQQGFAADDRMQATFRELCQDVQEAGLPNLEAAAELAVLARMDDDRVGAARGAVARVRDILAKISAHELDADRLADAHADLKTAAEAAELAFQGLRNDVEALFVADLGEIVERSLAAHAARMDELDVTADLDPSPAPRCRMDEEELAFVVDNLVENAVRAMAASPVRRLAVRWQGDGRFVTLTLADTGCGIAPDEQELIMTPGHTQRAGGGLGLPASREMLAKYGGSLTVRDSGPGRGTTMALMVPQARDGNAH